MKTTCKCHGVSGSCTVKTCWRQLAPFNDIGAILKTKYEKALKVITTTNKATGKSQLIKRKKSTSHAQNNQSPKSGHLVYIDNSPSYCSNGRYSAGTVGRYCIKGQNCGTMCCGRGYNVQSRVVAKPCNCQVIWCCDVQCQRCDLKEEVYSCK